MVSRSLFLPASAESDLSTARQNDRSTALGARALAGSPSGDQRDLVETTHGCARGVTCRNASGRGRPVTNACAAGPPTGHETGCSPRLRCMTTAHRCSGRLASTRRSCGRTSCRWRPQKGGSPTSPAKLGTQDGEAIGRSRGGLSTKIHLAVDGRGRPLSILLTPGQAGDNPQLLALLDAIRVNEPGPGRPRKRPDVLIADKGYAHHSTRRALRQRGIRVCDAPG